MHPKKARRLHNINECLRHQIGYNFKKKYIYDVHYSVKFTVAWGKYYYYGNTLKCI